MKILLIALIIMVSCVAANDLQREWLHFQKKFGKSYRSSLEATKRFQIFSNHLTTLKDHNARFQNGQETYSMGINQFSDWTDEERLNYVNNYVPTVEDRTNSSNSRKAEPTDDTPPSIDWRQKGVLTPVFEQTSTCQCCWAISATAVAEAVIKIAYDRLIPLSFQNLIDCVTRPRYYSEGCDGGLLNEALQYIAEEGIQTEQSYPYEDKQNEICKQNRTFFKPSRSVRIEPTEEDLRRAVAKQPVASGLQVTTKLFSYQSGIFFDPTWDARVNHAIVVVGYGTENGTGYWIIKNSWGEAWGDKGYGKIFREKSYRSGLSLQAGYLTL